MLHAQSPSSTVGGLVTSRFVLYRINRRAQISIRLGSFTDLYWPFFCLFNVCIQTFVNFLLDCLPFLYGLVKSEILVQIFFQPAASLLHSFHDLLCNVCVLKSFCVITFLFRWVFSVWEGAKNIKPLFSTVLTLKTLSHWALLSVYDSKSHMNFAFVNQCSAVPVPFIAL